MGKLGSVSIVCSFCWGLDGCVDVHAVLSDHRVRQSFRIPIGTQIQTLVRFVGA